ncbi:hypothetical protein QTN25_009818 [Entamoeba marina]
MAKVIDINSRSSVTEEEMNTILFSPQFSKHTKDDKRSHSILKRFTRTPSKFSSMDITHSPRTNSHISFTRRNSSDNYFQFGQKESQSPLSVLYSLDLGGKYGMINRQCPYPIDLDNKNQIPIIRPKRDKESFSDWMARMSQLSDKYMESKKNA